MRPEADLIVVGAGPKAIAIAAKVHAINQLGLGPVSLVVVEQSEIAASWSGINGMTSGNEQLAITPLKDIGFPYETRRILGRRGLEIDFLLAEFSWPRYLIEEDRYALWLNAGLPRVPHCEYGRYLAWVLARATDGVEVVAGRVTQVAIERDRDRWTVELEEERCRASSRRSRALALTGTGVHRALPHDSAAAPRVFHCDSRRDELARIPAERRCDVAIAGGGDGALSCAVYLRTVRPDANLTIYTPNPPLSRGESFLENRVFSNPDCVKWESLDIDVRSAFIRHTYQGVFGPTELEKLATDDLCRFVTGRVTHVAATPKGLSVSYQNPEGAGERCHDYVVNCTGFDVIEQIRPLFSESLRAEIEEQVGPIWEARAGREIRFGRTLELDGLRPRLHIPGLAALSQGPGFANLGCLGLLSDRVLYAFLANEAEDVCLEEAVA